MRQSEKFSSSKKTKPSYEKKDLSFTKKRLSLNKTLNLKTQKVEKSAKRLFFFRLKGIFYLIRQDKHLKLFRKFLIKRPFFYSFNLLKSLCSKNNHKRVENHFFYKLKNFNDLQKKAKDRNVLFVFGFSYCMKPLACPKKRFSSDCIHDPNNTICHECFIGKCISLISKDDIYLVIPDAYYIGDKLIKIKHNNPKKELVFIIFACNFSINMFSDFSNMLNLKGLAIQLIGRVCINYKSFLFAEKGKKPGLTFLDNSDKLKLIKLLNYRQDSSFFY